VRVRVRVWDSTKRKKRGVERERGREGERERGRERVREKRKEKESKKRLIGTNTWEMRRMYGWLTPVVRQGKKKKMRKNQKEIKRTSFPSI
jgi:hypothetical protein